MARTLGERLASLERQSFVGRDAERGLIREALAAPELPFAVAYVSGPGGIGKSSFLRAIIDDLPSDWSGIYLDCRDVEPTPDAVERALRGILAVENDDHTTLSPALSRWPRVVIALDSYENFGLVDAWLRQTFLPALPENVLTVIAGRERPSPGWSTSPGWQHMFREIRLSALDEQCARDMLARRGVDGERAAHIARFARGYPLALELAATAMRTQGGLTIEEGAATEVMARLTQRVLAALPAPVVEALEASAHVRRVSEPLLAALLDRTDVRSGFNELRGLSFVSQRPHGLYLHDVVREAIARDSAQRDPAASARYRERAWRFLSAASRRVEANALWQYTADLLFLVQNPNVRNAFFYPGAVDVSVEQPVPRDGSEIEAIAAAHEAADKGEWLIRWWRRHPETFKVARTSSDRVAGFYLIFERGDVDQELLQADPVTASWCAHLDSEPIGASERALFCRRWMSRKDGESMGAVQAACWLDIKRLYMEMRPHLRRIYCPVNDIASYAPVVTPLGFKPIESAQVEVNGVMFYTAMLDFGEDSVDGWLKGLVGAEIVTFGEALAQRAGVQTVLFTDLVGHTEMMRRLGDERGRDVLRAHERITRDVLKQHGGTEVKTMGDGFMASFASVTRAMDCAIALQRAFAAHAASADGEALHVRVGLNAGEPIEEDGDLFGSTVIMASRVAAQAGAGEILIPEPLRHLLTGKSYEYANRGETMLKGFEDAVRLYEVRWRD